MSTHPSPKPPAPAHGRFIPREELHDFASWQPGAFASGGGSAAAPEGARHAKAAHATLQAERQSGYQDGYRDGLVALEGFKRSLVQQNMAQLSALMSRFDAQLDALEQQLAQCVARVATELARQVVRDELQTSPQRIARVAHEAVTAVLMSARHIVVQVHPQDHALLEQTAAEVMVARGARVVSDASIEPGGCRVTSDVGTIDARVGARWAQATRALGTELPWAEDASGEPR